MSMSARRLQRTGFGGSVDGGAGPQAGATLYLTPTTGSYANGATVTVQIRINSGVEEVNTYQANVSYPTAQLQMVSVVTTGSPFGTVIQNVDEGGLIKLSAGILGGGTSGDQLAGTVTFTAIGTGQPSLNFAVGSGVARRSDSTDICQNKVGATYTIS